MGDDQTHFVYVQALLTPKIGGAARNRSRITAQNGLWNGHGGGYGHPIILRCASRDHAVDEQHNYCSDDRHDETSRLAVPIQAHGAAQPPAYEGAHDAKGSRYDEAAWVTSRHQELRNHTHNQSEKDPDDDVHVSLLSSQRE
jgi:hypothetical protein